MKNIILEILLRQLKTGGSLRRDYDIQEKQASARHR